MLAHLRLQARLGVSMIEIKLDPVSSFFGLHSLFDSRLWHCLDTGAGQVLQNIYSVVIALIQSRIEIIYVTKFSR